MSFKNCTLEKQIEDEQKAAAQRRVREQLQTWESRPSAPAPLRSIRAIAEKGRRGEYDDEMADYIEQAVYAGVEVEVAHKAIGISKDLWAQWGAKSEDPYASLMARVEVAKNALLVRLHKEIARSGDTRWKTWLVERLAGKGAAESQPDVLLVHSYEALPADRLAHRAEELAAIAKKLRNGNGKTRARR